MNVTFYNNKSNHNVINKDIEFIEDIQFNFKDNVSVVTPKLILKGYKRGNYAYIPSLKRYYFIDDIVLLKGGVYELSLSIDVLMTYKTDIINNKYYSDTGIFKTVANKLDFNTIYNNKKFLLIIGG